MKRQLKRILLAAYRRTEFIRRPLRAELEANFKTCVASSFDEVRIAMDGLVAEVYRLQDQVTSLREEVASLHAERESLVP